jgi:RYK receptor-like tyrosine kinase
LIFSLLAVSDFACPTQVQLLLKEGLSMCDLKHRNIMAVMGVSMEEHAEPFIIYLREGYSNLKK